ncbi:MAG: response regulator transcription factor [Bacteroidota bacterium]
MDKLKIIIVDDHQLVRDGIKSLLDGEDRIIVIGEAGEAHELNSLIVNKLPDIILMDISLPGQSGIEITAFLTEHFPSVRVIILSMYNQEEFVLNALKAGARGYIPKNTTRKEMMEAIHAVSKGEEYLGEQVSRTLLKSLIRKKNQEPKDKPDITAREIEILKLLAQGLQNQEIADKLFISVRTVESHKNHIMQKLEIKNNIELVKYLAREGFLEI